MKEKVTSPVIGNLLKDLPAAAREELFDQLVSGQRCRLERIVSHGHRSPSDYWYDQDEDEWVLVLSGRARLQLEATGTEVELAPGDWIDLPAHCRHRVLWTSEDEPTVWLALFYTRHNDAQISEAPAP